MSQILDLVDVFANKVKCVFIFHKVGVLQNVTAPNSSIILAGSDPVGEFHFFVAIKCKIQNINL